MKLFWEHKIEGEKIEFDNLQCMFSKSAVGQSPSVLPSELPNVDDNNGSG